MACFFFPRRSDSRIWQSLSGHEWDYPSVFPPEWRGCSLSHFWGKDFCWHLSLPGGALQDHQASQGLLHGGGWCGTTGKDEPAERTEIQVEVDMRERKQVICHGSVTLFLTSVSCLCLCNERVSTSYSHNIIVIIITKLLWDDFFHLVDIWEHF